RVVVAVRYDSFHDSETAKRVVATPEGAHELDGDALHGSEIELWEVLPATGEKAPIELLVQLDYASQHDLDNEEHGKSWWETINSGEDAWQRAMPRPSTFLPPNLPRDSRAYADLKVTAVRVSVAGSDPRQHALVLTITDDLSMEGNAFAERIYALLVNGE